MNAFNQKISETGVVPVIKLNNPERDAVPLARALCAGGVSVAEVTFGERMLRHPGGQYR